MRVREDQNELTAELDILDFLLACNLLSRIPHEQKIKRKHKNHLTFGNSDVWAMWQRWWWVYEPYADLRNAPESRTRFRTWISSYPDRFSDLAQQMRRLARREALSFHNDSDQEPSYSQAIQREYQEIVWRGTSDLAKESNDAADQREGHDESATSWPENVRAKLEQPDYLQGVPSCTQIERVERPSLLLDLAQTIDFPEGTPNSAFREHLRDFRCFCWRFLHVQIWASNSQQ